MSSKEHQEQFQAKGRGLLASPGKSANFNLETKPLPLPRGERVPEEEFVHEFSRNDLRELIHLITQELKLKGTKTPNIFLAFRSRMKTADLTNFLEHTLIVGKKPASTATLEKFVREADEFTLVAALKYLWARLPTGSIIGWEAYDSFKNLEERERFPKRAFLEFMPQCLSSPSHASIVYDFLDLIVSMAANAKENLMSGRKLAKMCAIWAFHGPPSSAKLTKSRLDPTENSFTEGLKCWIPAANAMFHLLLSFLRSMLPDDHTTKLQLPRNLQALLASNSYPPPDLTSPSKHMIEVPLVTIRTNYLSNSPIEMLNRVPKILSFENPDLFQAKEDYALLKAFCQKDGNILSRLSGESRKVLELMSQTKSENALKAGWPTYNRPVDEKGKRETTVAVSRVPIEDYFVWAWSATISSEQPARKKRIFGRSLIQEVAFDGYKKTIIIEEQNTYSHVRNNQPPLPELPKGRDTTRVPSQPNYKSMLDDLPDLDGKELPMQKKKKKPKTKPLQENNGLEVKRNMSFSSPKLTGLLKKFEKQELIVPALPKKDPSLPDLPLEHTTYEPVELPEVEKGQYRLSIPLDGFGFDDDQPQYQQPQQEQYYQQPAYYENQQDGNQYQSLAPPSPSNEPYQYWSAKEPEAKPGGAFPLSTDIYQPALPSDRSGRNTIGVFDQLDQSHVSAIDTEIPLPESSYDLYHPPPSPTRESGYRNSIESLSNMVNEMSVQVNQVGKKLDKDGFANPAPLRPMYDVVTPNRQTMRPDNYPSTDPPPSQRYEPEPEMKPTRYQSPQELRAMARPPPQEQQQQQHHHHHHPNGRNNNEPQKLHPMYEFDTPEEHRTRPISYVSSELGRVSDQKSSRPQSRIYETVPGIPSGTSPGKPKLSPILTTRRFEPKTSRKAPSQGEEELNYEVSAGPPSNVSSNPNGPSSSFYEPTPGSSSFINNGLTNMPSPSNYDSSDYQPLDQFETITPASSDQQQQQQESVPAPVSEPQKKSMLLNSTEHDSCYTAKPKGDTNIDYEGGETEDKRYSAQSHKYPESIIDNYRQSSVSGFTSVGEFSAVPTPTSARGNFPRDDQLISKSFSTTDANYIPESNVPDQKIPFPELPKSPIRKRKPVPASPEKKQTLKGHQPQPLAKMSFQESQDGFSSEYHTAASSEYDQYHTAPPSDKEFDGYRHPAARSTPRYYQPNTEIPPPAQKYQQPQQLQLDQVHQQTASGKSDYGYEREAYLQPAQPQHHYPQGQNSTTTPIQQQYQANNYPQQPSSQTQPQGQSDLQQKPYPDQSSQSFSPNRQRGPQAPLNNGNGVFPDHSASGPSPPRGHQPHSEPSSYNKVQLQSHINPLQRQPATSPASKGSRQSSPYVPGPSNSHPPSNSSASPLQVPPPNYPNTRSPASSQELRGRSPQNPGHRRTNSPSANSISSRGRSQPPQQLYGYPPQGYYPPPQQSYYPPPPQGYYPPPQGYPPQGYPPQGYPPQGYPPQGYYPPPPQGWYPPPPPQGGHPGYANHNSSGSLKGSSPRKASDMVMGNAPTASTMNKLHHRPKADKKGIRAALTQGDFGI